MMVYKNQTTLSTVATGKYFHLNDFFYKVQMCVSLQKHVNVSNI